MASHSRNVLWAGVMAQRVKLLLLGASALHVSVLARGPHLLTQLSVGAWSHPWERPGCSLWLLTSS